MKEIETRVTHIREAVQSNQEDTINNAQTSLDFVSIQKEVLAIGKRMNSAIETMNAPQLPFEDEEIKKKKEQERLLNRRKLKQIPSPFCSAFRGLGQK